VVVFGLALLLCTGLFNPSIIAKGSLVLSRGSLTDLALPGQAYAQTDTDLSTNLKDTVTKLYREIYCPSNRTISSWEGDLEAGDFGSVSPDYIEAIKQRISFFRALARVPSTVSFDSPLNTYASQAALMMSVNKKISHSPDSSWLYYSSKGAEAAASSNLSLGTAGPETIDDFIADDGNLNSSVGHRRWLLFPSNASFGLGLVDPPQSTFPSALALWVVPPLITASSPAYSWPPPGFVPYSLVFQRWSFSLSGADFSNTRITVLKDGKPQEIILEPIVSGFGDNTIVWQLVKPVVPTNTDSVFSVSISNVRTPQNDEKDFSYTVTAYSPDSANGPSDEKILYHTEAMADTGILVHYLTSDEFGCIPQRNPGIEILWAQIDSDTYKPFTNAGSKGKIFLPKGFRYLLRIKNSNINAGPFELGPLGTLKSPPNNLVSPLSVVRNPAPESPLPVIVESADTPMPILNELPTATPSVSQPAILASIIAEATTNSSPELSITSKTRTPTPTPFTPITSVELKIRSAEDSAEILAWTEDDMGMNNQMTQVSLYVTSSPRINGMRFRSFDTDPNGEVRLKFKVKRIFRTFRSQSSRKPKRLYMKACVSPYNICSKFVLIENS
jgi:uncharacterized protein YkwD